MTSPHQPIDVVLIGTTPEARDPLCDPAVNLGAKGIREALSRYERERTPEALAEVPMHEGKRPVMFRVEPLTNAALQVVESQPSQPMRDAMAFLLSCFSYTDERGARREAVEFGKVDRVRDYPVGPDAWLEHVAGEFGGVAVAELASVAVDRARAGRRALAPFALPRGVMLPR